MSKTRILYRLWYTMSMYVQEEYTFLQLLFVMYSQHQTIIYIRTFLECLNIDASILDKVRLIHVQSYTWSDCGKT